MGTPNTPQASASIKGDPHWAPFEGACEALRRYVPRARALEWIVQGDLRSYATWAHGEGYEAAYGTGKAPEWKVFDRDTQRHLPFEATKEQWWARALFSPIPLDGALLDHMPQMPEEYWSTQDPRTYVQRMGALFERIEPMAHWGLTPYEIALRESTAEAFDALVAPLLEHKAPAFAWVYGDDAALRDTCMLKADVRVRAAWLARTKVDTNRWLTARTGDKCLTGTLSSAGYFLLLGQMLGCSSKAARAARLFAPEDFETRHLFSMPTEWEDMILPTVQALAQGTPEQARQALDRCARIVERNEAFTFDFLEVWGRRAGLEPGAPQYEHLMQQVHQGATSVRAIEFLGWALDRGADALARLLLRSLPYRWECADESPNVRAHVKALYEQIQLEDRVTSAPTRTGMVKQRL
jgi:hypothetical protein